MSRSWPVAVALAVALALAGCSDKVSGDASEEEVRAVLDECGADALGEGKGLGSVALDDIPFYVNVIADCAERRGLGCGDDVSGATSCGARDSSDGFTIASYFSGG